MAKSGSAPSRSMTPSVQRTVSDLTHPADPVEPATLGDPRRRWFERFLLWWRPRPQHHRASTRFSDGGAVHDGPRFGEVKGRPGAHDDKGSGRWERRQPVRLVVGAAPAAATHGR